MKIKELFESFDLLTEFENQLSLEEKRLYAIRDNCGPAAISLIMFAKKHGIELKRVGGYFKADQVVYDKADFTREMKKEFTGNFNSAKERKEWIENNPKYSEEWKLIPHYWCEDAVGKIYDPTGKAQFIKKGLSKDLDKSRYIKDINKK